MVESKYILIVDDSDDLRSLLKTLLEDQGYTVDCTGNGEEALLLLNSSQKLPDAILLDMKMPVMGGMAFRLKQQSDPRLRHIPVIAFSGDGNSDIDKAMTGSDILKKPVDVSILLEAVYRNSHELKKA